MNKVSPAFISNLLIVILMFAMGYLYFNQLPDQIITHWNMAGEVDGTMSKLTALILFPSIALFFTLLFPLLRHIDPKNESYLLFKRAWGFMQVGIIGFLAYIYFITLYATLNPETSVIQFIVGGLGVLFTIIGFTIKNIHQNFFVGIRTPWTLSSEIVWNKTHKLGGNLFALAGIISFVDAFFMIRPVMVLLVAILTAVLLSVFYSYYLYRNLK